MEGYLKKCTNLITRWKTRYVIVENEVLKYYSKHKRSLKGSYLLSNSQLIQDHKEPKNLILKLNSGEIIYFQIPSIEFKDQWLNSFIHSGSKYVTNNNDQFMGNNNSFQFFENFRNSIIKIINSKLLNGKNKMNQTLSELHNLTHSLDEYINELAILSEKIQTQELNTLSKKIMDVAVNLKTNVFESNVEIEDTKADLIQAGEILVSEVEKIIKAPQTFEKDFIRNDGKDISNQSQKKDIEKEDEDEEEVNKKCKFYEDVFVDAAQISFGANNENNSVNNEPKEREYLPVKKDPNARISLWTVLKDLIGKDLTHFSLPVYFNEPISLIQRTAEAFENDYLIDKAAKEKESISRILLLSAYAICQFNSVYPRVTKPFNPILGETYELVTDRYKLFGEQVSHHPPICAMHVESDNYIVEQDSQVKIRFWGRSLECIPIGFQRFYFKTTKEIFLVQSPSVYACNIIIGKFFVELGGESKIENVQTKEKAVISFKRKGWSDSTLGIVEGFVKDRNGKKVYEIKGKWFERIQATNLETNETILLWEAFPRPNNYEFYYYFCRFTMQLNYLPENLKKILPPTDSRMRPDQRALENGLIKLAAQEKSRIEDKQRAARKEREFLHLKYKPVYFDEVLDSQNNKIYRFNNKYWEDREKQNWSHLPNIF